LVVFFLVSVVFLVFLVISKAGGAFSGL